MLLLSLGKGTGQEREAGGGSSQFKDRKQRQV